MLNSISGYSGINRFIALLFVALIVASCSTVHDLVPDTVSNVLPGKANEEVILTGERLAVLKNSSQALGVEVEASESPVIIPQAFVNANWAQPGGRASNSIEHLA